MAQGPHPAERASHPAPRPKAQQNGHSGQWLRQHKDLPPEQQKRALQNDPQFRNLPPQQKQRLQNQLDRFNTLPPQKRQQMLNRMDTFGHLTPEQKDTARQLHSEMQQLPPQRRQAVRNAIGALRAMPPEARQRQIDSDAYKKQFTPEERNILGGASKIAARAGRTQRAGRVAGVLHAPARGESIHGPTKAQIPGGIRSSD